MSLFHLSSPHRGFAALEPAWAVRKLCPLCGTRHPVRTQHVEELMLLGSLCHVESIRHERYHHVPIHLDQPGASFPCQAHKWACATRRGTAHCQAQGRRRLHPSLQTTHFCIPPGFSFLLPLRLRQLPHIWESFGV
eukprot:EG_transcript_37571